MSSGGGSSQPTQQTVTQVTIPPELMPYAKRALGTAEQLTYETPYQSFAGQRFAGLNPLQQQAMLQTQQQQTASQLGQATGMAGLAGMQAGQLGQYAAGQYQPLDTNFQGITPQELQQYQMQGPRDVAAQTDFGNIYAPSLQNLQMGPAERVTGGEGGVSSLQPYMSPYMQDVVETQKREAIRDYARQLPGLGAAAARAGSLGGTRSALMQSEAQRNLQNQMQGLQAAGTQQAFQQAQQQYNIDQAQRMQAALANQQAGLTVGQQNLAAALQTQGLGAQQAMQAQLANQQGRITGGQMGLQAALANQAAQQAAAQQNLAARLGVQSLGAQQSLAAQQANQQAQLQAQQQALQQRQFGAQFGEQSRQFGANLGLQGIQQQLAAAQALSGIGQAQFGQQQAINQAQLAAGAQLQGLEQQRLQAAYEDFINRQKYPYLQLGFMSDLIRGTPTAGGIQTMYAAPPSTLGQLGGLGLSAAALAGKI